MYLPILIGWNYKLPLNYYYFLIKYILLPRINDDCFLTECQGHHSFLYANSHLWSIQDQLGDILCLSIANRHPGFWHKTPYLLSHTSISNRQK